MTRLTKPSASGLDRFLRCQMSALLPQVRREGSEYAIKGRQVHAYLERRGLGQTHEQAAFLVEGNDARDLCSYLADFDFPAEIQPEVTFAWSPEWSARIVGHRMDRADYNATDEIFGRADAVVLLDDRVCVYDYKTGNTRVYAEDSYQLHFLALCACRAFDRDSAEVAVLQISPDGEVFTDRATLDVFALEAFELKLRQALEEPSEIAVDGAHCKFCPAYDSCPAKTAAMQMALALPVPTAITSESATHAYHVYRTVKEAVEYLGKQLHDYAKETPITVDERTEYRVVQRHRTHLDHQIATAVVAEELGEEFAKPITRSTVSQASIKAALGRAGRRPRELKRLLELIQDRDGLTMSTYETVTEVRVSQNGSETS